MENVVEVKEIVKTYKNFKLNKVSFNIPRNSIVGFIGGNGSGKSTTMKSILSLVNVESGSINIFSKNIKDLTKSERENIGVVLDEVCLPEKLKIRLLDNIFKGIFKNWDSDTYFKYLKEFNIDPELTSKQLSKGMKVKLNLSIAFSRNVKLLVLDEPVNGLDPVARDEIDNMLLNFVKKDENAVFISSHILSDLEKICDKIIFIDNGKILFDEKTNDLINMFYIKKVNKDEFYNFNKDEIIRYKEFGDIYEILLKRDGKTYDILNKPTLEDIMIMFTKGKTI